MIREGDRGQSDDTFALLTVYGGQADVGNPIERGAEKREELCLKGNIYW